MTSRPEIQNVPSAGWQRMADRLARYSWLVLLGAIGLALVGGAIYAATWEPRGGEVGPGQEACVDPPCFDPGGLPSARELPVVIPTLGYLLAVVLGLPSLPAGIWDTLRGRWAAGGGRLLIFVGPVLFLIGTEIVPHVLSPCLLEAALGPNTLAGICQGFELADRWHALHHTLVGAVPMAALYLLALRRWRPQIPRLSSDSGI